MEKLSCGKCKFTWTSKTGRIPNQCPYCGNRNAVMDTINQQEGFRDVDDLLK